MVKVNDLGYISQNLERIPSKEDQKQASFRRALSNLAAPSMPDRLSPTVLPDSILKVMGVEE